MVEVAAELLMELIYFLNLYHTFCNLKVAPRLLPEVIGIVA